MSGFLMGLPTPAATRDCGAGSVGARRHRQAAWSVPLGWIQALAAALEVISTRRQLAAMDQRMLSDIGVSRSEALEEANRAPWDLPWKAWRHPREQL